MHWRDAVDYSEEGLAVREHRLGKEVVRMSDGACYIRYKDTHEFVGEANPPYMIEGHLDWRPEGVVKKRIINITNNIVLSLGNCGMSIGASNKHESVWVAGNQIYFLHKPPRGWWVKLRFQLVRLLIHKETQRMRRLGVKG